MLACVHKYCPKRNITTKLSQPKWFTRELSELLYDRDLAFTEAYNAPHATNLLMEAKKLRTKAKKALRLARSEYTREHLNNHSDDPRKFWAHLNNLIKRKPTTASIQLNDEHGNPLDQNKTPDYINKYFSTIGPKLAEGFQTQGNSSSNTTSHDSSTIGNLTTNDDTDGYTVNSTDNAHNQSPTVKPRFH